MNKYPKKLLMVKPNGFRVEYEINPHMDVSNSVNYEKALEQWNDIHDLYLKLGIEVEIIEGDERFPDMVFCANPFFSYPDGILIGKMRYPQRQGEVDIYQKYFSHYSNIEELFEGNGDLIWNYETGELYGGHGFRTSESIYEKVSELVGVEINLLELVNENFYHLDTCLCILSKDCAAIVKSAFNQEGLRYLRGKFSDLIELDEEESVKFLAANALSVDGKNIIVEKGAVKFQEELAQRKFVVHPVDTSEYLKAGGSVFCMKHLIF